MLQNVCSLVFIQRVLSIMHFGQRRAASKGQETTDLVWRGLPVGSFGNYRVWRGVLISLVWVQPSARKIPVRAR